MKKTIFGCLLVFSIVLSGLLSATGIWMFSDDDFGAFWTGKSVEPKDFLEFFGSATNDATVLCSDQTPVFSFWRTTFRPLTMLLYVFIARATTGLGLGLKQAPLWIFNLWVALHALAAVLLFLMLGGGVLGFFGAIYFAFHASLASAIGRLCTVPYVLVLILLMLATLLFDKSRRSQSWAPLLSWASATLWMAAILMHEVALFFPAWLAIVMLWQRPNFRTFTLVTHPFILMAALYLCLKLRAFDLSWPQNPGFGFGIVDKFYNYLSMAIDLCGLRTQSYKFLGAMGLAQCWAKGLILLFSSAFFTSIVGKKLFRKRAILASLGFLNLSWTSTLLRHHARYLYWPLPFFVATLIEGARHDTLKTRALCTFFLALALVGLSEQREYLRQTGQRNTANFQTFARIASHSAHSTNIRLAKQLYPTLAEPGSAQAIWLCLRMLHHFQGPLPRVIWTRDA